MTKMNVYELLVTARDVFAERGGAKHILLDSDTKQVCAIGAINVAHHGQAEWEDLNDVEGNDVLAARNLLNQHCPIPETAYYPPIVVYNNRTDITKDDVLAIFDKAIAGYEEKVVDD